MIKGHEYNKAEEINTYTEEEIIKQVVIVVDKLKLVAKIRANINYSFRVISENRHFEIFEIFENFERFTSKDENWRDSVSWDNIFARTYDLTQS